MNLQTGDVLVERSRGWFGALLSAFLWPLGLRPAWQHVRVVHSDPAFVIEDGEDRDEATGEFLGFRVCVNRAPADLSPYEVRRPPCSRLACLGAVALMESRLGEPYGVLSALAFWFRRAGIPVRDLYGSTCSELAAWAFAEQGVKLSVPWWDAAPWDFREWPRAEED